MPASSAPAPQPWPGLEDSGLALRFESARFLGAGPDGIAVAAQRRDDGGQVELRFVPARVHSKALLQRWSRYRLILHPHVVRLESLERTREDWCVVLSGQRERSLAGELGRAFPAEAALRLLEQLASALASAHDVGISHGRLDPDAVWLDGSRSAQLEFSGVRVTGGASLPGAVAAGTAGADRYADLLGLANIAELLFQSRTAALDALPWLDRLKHDDPLSRPSARAVCALLERERGRQKGGAARRVLETIDTERPEPPRAAPEPLRLDRTRPSVAPLASPAPSAQRAPAAGKAPPERVGRFRIERLLGEGGMGSVYRAVDAASGQVVALKLLKPELLADEAVQYRFRKEARVLAAVQSPYVANLVEAQLDDELGYIALEFVDGRDLATLMTEHARPLDESLALAIVADLCRALIEPHRHGIVHRDIKPQNVLVVGALAEPGQLAIKLCDFGIASARLSAETVGMTQDGRLWGTPQYMAPEQCSSSPVSPATDVYALGLTLYELIAGRPAFQGDEVLPLLRQQLYEQPKDLRECASVSDGTAALVSRALEKSPDRRFADAGELLAELDRLRAGQALQTASSVAPARGRASLIRFSLDLAASPLELWPFVSNTARMNEIVGLPPVAVERLHRDGSTQTFLSNRVLGIDMRWREYPFEWVEGRSWSVLRVCSHGVTRWYRVRLELDALPAGGTRLTYSMEYEPVWAPLAFIVKLEVGIKQKRRLSRVFRRVDALIQSGAVQRDPSPHVAPERLAAGKAQAVLEKLAALRSRRVDEAILRALERHVMEAPDVEIARIRPLRFARMHGLDERRVTEAFLLGTRQGLFDLLWDVICPLCQIPASFAESLEKLGTHSDCPACELQFPLDFASSVELVFRVSSALRPSEVRAYCIGGPAHSPHVAAQLTLAPGEGRVLGLELTDGRHRIRSPQLPGVIELDVSARHGFARADLVVNGRLAVVEPGQRGHDPRLDLRAPDPTLCLSSGRQTLGLRNEIDREVTLRVERLAGQSDALTAARAWAMPRFREWFPGETLQSGRLVAVGQLSFLVLRVVDHLALIERRGDAVALAETLRVFDELHAAAERHDGRLLSASMDRVVAAFERQDSAVSAALELARALARPELLASSLALHRGPAVATTIDARMEYYGKTLAEALDMASSAGAREVVISAAALGEALERLHALPGARVTMRPAPQLGAAEWCAQLELGERPPSLPSPAASTRASYI
jgi:serine/threonine protein kinase